MLGVVGALIAFPVLIYLVVNKLIRNPICGKIADAIVKWVSLAFGLWCLIVVLGLMYKEADGNGWFAHKLVATVWMPRNWITGEFKSCVLDGDKKLTLLSCGEDATPHEMNVEFRGSLDGLESKKPTTWTCLRGQESVSCKSK
jgi:hypothetical protein